MQLVLKTSAALIFLIFLPKLVCQLAEFHCTKCWKFSHAPRERRDLFLMQLQQCIYVTAVSFLFICLSRRLIYRLEHLFVFALREQCMCPIHVHALMTGAVKEHISCRNMDIREFLGMCRPRSCQLVKWWRNGRIFTSCVSCSCAAHL